MAKDLGVSPKTFRRQIRDKKIPYTRVGRQIRVDPVRVHSILDTVDSDEPTNVVLFAPRIKVKRTKFAEAVGL